jgi:hypothetical protein
VALLPPALLLLADVVVFAVSSAGIIPVNGVAVGALGTLVLLLSLLLVFRARAWQRAYFVVTASRIMTVNWRRGQPLTVLPIAAAADMTYIQPLPGRFFDYGSFRFAGADRTGRPVKIGCLPYPEQLFLEINGILFPEQP